MKRSLQEIGGMEGFEDEPQPPKKSPWANRMKWKPNGNPLLHPDEEAALAAGQGGEVPIQQRPARPAPVKPTMPQHPRFQWQPDGGAVEKPNLRFMASSDVDAILKAVRDEEAKPPHQQNSATLARLKAEAMRMMSREESQWVQRTADQMLPRVDEVKIYAASTKPYPGSTPVPKPKPGWQKLCRRCGKPSGTKSDCGCKAD